MLRYIFVMSLYFGLISCNSTDFGGSTDSGGARNNGGAKKATTTTLKANPGTSPQSSATTIPGNIDGGDLQNGNGSGGGLVNNPNLNTGNGGGGATNSTTPTLPTNINVPAAVFGDFYLTGQPGSAKQLPTCNPAGPDYGMCDVRCNGSDVASSYIGDCGPWPNNIPAGPGKLTAWGGCHGHRLACKTSSSDRVVVNIRLTGGSCPQGMTQVGSIFTIPVGANDFARANVCKETKSRQEIRRGDLVVTGFRLTQGGLHSQGIPNCDTNNREEQVGAILDCVNPGSGYRNGCEGWQSACVKKEPVN